MALYFLGQTPPCLGTLHERQNTIRSGISIPSGCYRAQAPFARLE